MGAKIYELSLWELRAHGRLLALAERGCAHRSYTLLCALAYSLRVDLISESMADQGWLSISETLL
jgi:hypothetical protein